MVEKKEENEAVRKSCCELGIGWGGWVGKYLFEAFCFQEEEKVGHHPQSANPGEGGKEEVPAGHLGACGDVADTVPGEEWVGGWVGGLWMGRGERGGSNELL